MRPSTPRDDHGDIQIDCSETRSSGQPSRHPTEGHVLMAIEPGPTEAGTHCESQADPWVRMGEAW